MKRTTFLLPVNFRFVGFLFFMAGLFLATLRFYWGVKPEWLNFKIFAIYSAYLENKYLEVIGNNFAEEVSGFLLLSGLFFIAFSRQRIELAAYNELRLKAFFIATYLNFAYLVIAMLFTYGFAFVYMLMVNMGFGLLAYIIAFYLLKARLRRESATTDQALF